MDINVRNEIRTSVVNTLVKTFPQCKLVAGGVAFLSDVLDEATGTYIPVEIKVSVKNTQATATGAAYDIDAAAEAFANKPPRRVADPAKAAEKAARSEAAALRKEAAINAILSYGAKNPVHLMNATELQAAVPELANYLPMQVGTVLKAMVENGQITVTLSDDGKRKKLYTIEK